MGSDHPPSLLLEAVCKLAAIDGGNELFLLFATEDTRKVCQKAKRRFPDKIACRITKNSISMAENPLFAIRRKKDSTICAGVQMLKRGEIQAFVSAGNTGALMTAAKMFLPSLPGISRPALLALMPTCKSPVAVLDVGANLNCKSEHLVQFAAMGAAFQHVKNIERPRIGLLNIGSEAKKGTTLIRKAYHDLQKSTGCYDFIGNIESKDVFSGLVDVVITEGFTGNIFLKTAEGMATFILDRISESKGEFHLPPTLQEELQKQLHYAEYPGAILCGIKGIIIKCHSYSTPQAFANGIKGAIELHNKNFINKIEQTLIES